ncbi:MAG: hypothetical protein JST75_14260 [Bacteroidetes bacterium]|nr:hypothetical protein [Bacteroidota bacterium]
MKSLLILFVTSLFIIPKVEFTNVAAPGAKSTGAVHEKFSNKDSSQLIRFINTSSLKNLPDVIKDLSATLNETIFQKEQLLGKDGFTIYMYVVTCNNAENSAAVKYRVNDTIYHLKLNRFNQVAEDKALAATLIHEIMHCVLLNIYNRAKQQELTAQNSILNFGLNKNDSSIFFNNDFFIQMNNGEAGQHELIYRLFYPQMVSLLKRFASLHKKTSLSNGEAENLMWSGLQQTSAFKKLPDEEKKSTTLSILKAKGIATNEE